MSDDQFTKLFRYMEKRFGSIDERFDKHDREFADIRGTLADLAIELRNTNDEVHILNYQMSKGHTAIKEIAAATNVQLSVEL